MNVILNNNPNDYYAKLSPVYKYPLTVGTKVHKNVLSAILCNIFTTTSDIETELFETLNLADDNNLSITERIEKVVEIKDKYKLIFKSMPDIHSIITDIMCQRYRSDELSSLENLVKHDENYTFYDPTGLLGENDTPFSLGLYNKFIHILATVGANECYIIQEIERF